MELTAVRWGHFLYRGRRRCLDLPLRLCHAGGDDDGQHEGNKEEPHFVALQGERALGSGPKELYRPGTPDVYLICKFEFIVLKFTIIHGQLAR